MSGKIEGWLRSKRGFTLVEILIVVAIVAILAVIAIPRYNKYRLRGYKAELDSDSKSVYVAAQAYLTDNMASTVDTFAKLYSGGYRKSTNVVYVAGGAITISSGSISIYSSVLNSQGMDNNSVIFYDGRMELVNAP